MDAAEWERNCYGNKVLEKMRHGIQRISGEAVSGRNIGGKARVEAQIGEGQSMWQWEDCCCLPVVRDQRRETQRTQLTTESDSGLSREKQQRWEGPGGRNQPTKV